MRCNWAQILEGRSTPRTARSLHSTDMVPAQVDGAKATEANWLRPSTDKAPRIQVERTNYGFRYAAIRRPIKNAATHDYIRTTVFIAPFTALIPPNNVYNLATLRRRWTTPTRCSISSPGTGPTSRASMPKPGASSTCCNGASTSTANFAASATRANDYQQDREAMKAGNFTGISGIPNQDIAMWETMGPIADRSKEKLGASDVAVVEFRRLMVEAARAMRDGGPAIGTTEPHMPHATISSFEGVVPKTTNWRSARRRQRGAARSGPTGRQNRQNKTIKDQGGYA